MNTLFQPTAHTIKAFFKSSSYWPSINESLFLFALTTLGLVGNHLNIELFFGVNFLFGSVATMLAVRASGALWGTFVGIIIGSYSFVLWGHHYAIITFGLEAFVVGFVSFYLKRDNLVLIDAGFWLFLGMPIVWVLYVFSLEVPEVTANMIALKQMVNGITNVTLASLLIQFTPVIQWKNLKGPTKASQKIQLNSVIHTVLAAFIVLPMLTITIISGQAELEETQRNIKAKVEIKALQASRELETALGFFTKSLGVASMFELSQAKSKHEHLKKTLDNLKSSVVPGLLNTEIINPNGHIFFSYPQQRAGISSFAKYIPSVTDTSHYVSDFDIEDNFKKMNFTLITPTSTDHFLAATFSRAVFGSLIATITDGDEVVEINDAQGSIVISNNKKDLSLFIQGENPHHFLPENTKLPPMLRWKKAYWKNTTSFINNQDWTVSVASPMQASMEFLEAKYTYKMASMVIICLGSLLIVPIVSRLLSAPLKRLTVASYMLTDSIERHDIIWPTSNIHEIDSLVHQFIKFIQAIKEQTIALYRSEEKYSQIVETASDGIISIDDCQEITLFNSGAETIFGFSAKEIIGESIKKIIPSFFYSDKEDSVDKLLARTQKTPVVNMPTSLFGVRKNGEEFTLSLTVSKALSADKTIFTLMFQDITQRETMRLKTVNIANELTQLIDTANAPIFGIDAQGNINEWNQQAEKITGFDKAEVIGRNLVANFITDDYKASVGLVLANALKGDETANYEFPLYTKAGDRIDILLNSTTRRDASGQIWGVVGVGQDITELNKVRIEQANIANELTQLIDTANAPIFGIDTQGNINEWNQQAEKITGFDKAEVIGLHLVADFITDDYKASVGLVLANALKGDETANYEFPLYTKAGDRIDILLNSTTRRDASGQIWGVVGVGQDITELNKVRIEQANIANELTQLIDTANAPIFGIDFQGNITEWNQQAEKITGFDKAEVIGLHLVADFITDDYKASVGLVLANALKGDETVNYEFILYTKAGDRIDILLSSSTRRDASGNIVGVVCVGQDITELNKVRIEQANIANELTQLIDTANAPIFGIDTQGNINEWNQQAEKITGFDKAEVIGRNLVADFITDDYKASVGLILANALKGDETVNYELILYTKAGDRIDILLNSTTRRDASGQIWGVVGVGQNITALNLVRDEQERERKQAANQIIQASKLATLGEMATSVAHELNQPLNVIRMASANSRRRIAKDDIDKEYLNAKLQRIEEQTTRAAAIIDHMRMFGREAKEPAVLVDPCKVVTQALDLIGEQLRLLGIEVVTELDKKCSPILGHPIQMEQVLLNLLTNARDAITQHNGESKITIRVFEDDNRINIVSEDTGGGISEDDLSRIFEPFFTTKEIGKGTGLGLSVSYGIIQALNGRIFAENINQGARFTITLQSSS
jgi:PAS domain S-box-containing protein